MSKEMLDLKNQLGNIRDSSAFFGRHLTQEAVLSKKFLTMSESESATEKASILGQEKPDKKPANLLNLPSPIITRRTRTDSTSARALENPQERGKVKLFCREKGHGFITSNRTGEDIFVHISDIEGEYVPLPGDEVEYRLCPIPPKYEKNQAIHVNIIHLTPEVHIKWDSLT